MSKTLIGIVSYGGLDFLRLCIRSIRETALAPVDIHVVCAQPNDEAMAREMVLSGVQITMHRENKGFPASVNDLLDVAFTDGKYDNLIIFGNDVVVMPGAIDAMIRTADSTHYEMICGSEFNSRFLVGHYPEAKKYFQGENFIFTDFSARPWELHKDFHAGVEPDTRKDIRNCTLFKRSAFEKAGYADVNFWPNGYYEDNDYCVRCDKLGVTACGLKEAAFFHFTSRTIHQNAQRDHGGYFSRNSGHYLHKWGGGPSGEKYELPYHGEGFQLTPEIWLSPDLKISTREQEDAIINYWRTL